MDETPFPVLDPGRKATKKGCFWAMAADDRGHGGPAPPVVLFRGRLLQCDACDGCNRLQRLDRPEGGWAPVHCRSHDCRRFAKGLRSAASPIAAAMIRHIAGLHAVWKAVRGLPQGAARPRRHPAMP